MIKFIVQVIIISIIPIFFTLIGSLSYINYHYNKLMTTKITQAETQIKEMQLKLDNQIKDLK